MLDLYNNQYEQETLKKHIYAISLVDILKTQKIDADFAVKYLLQPKYQLTKEESIITPKIVLHYQKHIMKEELYKKIIEYNSEDDDSIHF
jgi:hypothetical protein